MNLSQSVFNAEYICDLYSRRVSLLLFFSILWSLVYLVEIIAIVKNNLHKKKYKPKNSVFATLSYIIMIIYLLLCILAIYIIFSSIKLFTEIYNKCPPKTSQYMSSSSITATTPFIIEWQKKIYPRASRLLIISGLLAMFPLFVTLILSISKVFSLLGAKTV